MTSRDNKESVTMFYNKIKPTEITSRVYSECILNYKALYSNCNYCNVDATFNNKIEGLTCRRSPRLSENHLPQHLSFFFFFSRSPSLALDHQTARNRLILKKVRQTMYYCKCRYKTHCEFNFVSDVS